MMMKERPIIMQAESVRAILNGSKTQTRRVIKPQPCQTDSGRWYWQPRPTSDMVYTDINDCHWWGYAIAGCSCPYGQVGDHLWVRETWVKCDGELYYLANTLDRNGKEDAESKANRLDYGIKWKSPMFMPRWASRLTLEITGVRVERVSEISQTDAMQEGTTGKRTFANLWDSINGKRGYPWADSPFVWVLEFKRISQGG